MQKEDCFKSLAISFPARRSHGLLGMIFIRSIIICFCPYPYNHSKINHFYELQVVGGMPMKVMIAEPKVRKGSRTKKSSSHM